MEAEHIRLIPRKLTENLDLPIVGFLSICFETTQKSNENNEQIPVIKSFSDLRIFHPK